MKLAWAGPQHLGPTSGHRIWVCSSPSAVGAILPHHHTTPQMQETHRAHLHHTHTHNRQSRPSLVQSSTGSSCLQPDSNMVGYRRGKLSNGKHGDANKEHNTVSAAKAPRLQARARTS